MQFQNYTFLQYALRNFSNYGNLRLTSDLIHEICNSTDESLNKIISSLRIKELKITIVGDCVELPARLFSLNLYSLICKGVKLATIPPEIGNLHCLHTLLLCDNDIGNLPAEMHLLRSLKLLDLSYNHIADITVLCQLADLYKLNLNNNIIKHLPSEIVKLTNLRYLYLGNNLIEELPADFYKLYHCEVQLYKNSIYDTLCRLYSNVYNRAFMGPGDCNKSIDIYCIRKNKKQKILRNLVFMGCGAPIINSVNDVLDRFYF